MPNSEAFHGFGTATIHVGQQPTKWDMNQLVPPISLATTYKQTEPNQPIGYSYSRVGNPTRDVLEENLAALEGANYCKVFSSGMSAVVSMCDILKSGDHIICFDDAYAGTKRYLEHVAVKQHSLQMDYVDLTVLENLKKALKKNTKLVWFESPSNPLLKIVDIKGVVEIVRAFDKSILIVTDNTFMSPYYQRPLSLGVDAVHHSVTKYINGHTDVLMGAIMTNSERIHEHLKFMQLTLGTFPSAFDCFLVNRGVKTLHMRMQTHYINGLAVAKHLESHPAVDKVLYPALPSHPQHHVHKKQTIGMSGMLSVYLKGGLAQARAFVTSLQVFTLAESLGGFQSLAQIPALMTHASVAKKDRLALGITDTFIRISVGCEDVQDLIADLDQALEKAQKAT